MEIKKELLKKWTALRSPEDTGKLADIYPGGYKELFARAFRNGRCSDEVFKVMADFYEAKAQLIKEYV